MFDYPCPLPWTSNPATKRLWREVAIYIAKPQFGGVRTVDVRDISGLTIFFRAEERDPVSRVRLSSRRGGFCAIHAHTKAEPHARSTYERISSFDRPSLTWVYVPIAANDRLLSMRFSEPRKGLSFKVGFFRERENYLPLLCE